MSDTPPVTNVLGNRRPVHHVAVRDFRQPRRMSRARLLSLRVSLENALPDLERELHALTGLEIGLAPGELEEVDAETFLAAAGDPVCVLRFQSQGAPAWLVWDPVAAAALVEALLGSEEEPEARRLSPTEARLAVGVLTAITRAVASVTGVETSDFLLVQAVAELGTWREAGPAADSHRFVVPLELRQGKRTSTLRIGLAGVEGDPEPTAAELPAELPGHLEPVEIELCAELAGCELSLNELLSLEQGDVISVEARPGDPTLLRVEGRTVAHARLGRHAGRLAVRVERVEKLSGEGA